MKNPITYVIDTIKYSLFSDTHTVYSTVPGEHVMEERTYRLALSERLWDLAENLYAFECILCHGRYGYRIGPIDLEQIPIGRPRWNKEDGYMENSVASKLYDFGMYLCQKNNYSWEATPLTRRKLTEAEAASLCPDLYSSYQVDPEYPDELPCTYGATHDTCPGCLQYASPRADETWRVTYNEKPDWWDDPYEPRCDECGVHTEEADDWCGECGNCGDHCTCTPNRKGESA